jgi:hypothetical protein
MTATMPMRAMTPFDAMVRGFVKDGFDSHADRSVPSCVRFETMKACVTLDLESDHARRIPETAYASWEDRRVDELLGLLRGYGVPLTIFAVAGSLKHVPGAVDRFRAYGAEFHLHSFSHDLANPDSLDEIQRGADAFAEVFGHRPEGYRAPEGRISPEGLARLDDEGFVFDSSVFPSFWPRPRYMRFPRVPYRPVGRRLVEIPLATVTPARLIVSLSFLKLLGWSFYERLLERASLPEPLVFDMHLHDLWSIPSTDALGAPWKWIYVRNREAGMSILERFLALLARKGYELTTVGRVAREVAAC